MFGTYNIRNGRNRSLESALRGMSQVNMDLGIFQDAKLTNSVYTRGSERYSIFTMDALRQHRGGVEVFYRPSLRFAVEAAQKFVPNVVVFQMATRERRWYIVRCHVTPYNTLTIESVVAALKE